MNNTHDTHPIDAESPWYSLADALAMTKLSGIPISPRAAESPTADAAVCPQCQGSGWYTVPVPYGHPDFARLQACPCQQERQHAHALRHSGLVPYQSWTFDTFRRDVAGVREAAFHAHAFAEAPTGFLTFWGPSGTGKTHLAVAIGHVVAARRRRVRFQVVPDMLDELRQAFDPTRPVDEQYACRFNQLRSVDLLILDDLGTEQFTPWACEKVYQLINHRGIHHLPTIITTNQSLDLLEPRLRSRISDQTQGAVVVVIDADDYRRYGGR